MGSSLKNLTDAIDDIMANDVNLDHGHQGDPYEMAPSKHPDLPPNTLLNEPILKNPCSYEAVENVLRNILGSAKALGKEWCIAGCDGLPYLLGSRILAEKGDLQNVFLVPGLGHYEINMTRCAFKLLWDVVLEDLAKMLGFKSPPALESCHKCSDHHKSWQILMILLFGTSDELILPYVRNCKATNSVPTLHGFYTFFQSSQNPNYRFLFEAIFSYILALFVFRCGVRRNNKNFILAGKSKFTSLFYGFNMTTYQEIEYRDLRARVLAPHQLRSFLSENEAFSVTGHMSKGEGGDFVLEAWNKRIKRLLPPGLPDESDWVRVCKNVDTLDEVSLEITR